MIRLRPDEHEAIMLRLSALEKRTEHLERENLWTRRIVCVLAGLVVGAVLVCAFEFRAIYRAVEGYQWLSR